MLINVQCLHITLLTKTPVLQSASLLCVVSFQERCSDHITTQYVYYIILYFINMYNISIKCIFVTFHLYLLYWLQLQIIV